MLGAVDVRFREAAGLSPASVRSAREEGVLCCMAWCRYERSSRDGSPAGVREAEERRSCFVGPSGEMLKTVRRGAAAICGVCQLAPPSALRCKWRRRSCSVWARASAVPGCFVPGPALRVREAKDKRRSCFAPCRRVGSSLVQSNSKWSDAKTSGLVRWCPVTGRFPHRRL